LLHELVEVGLLAGQAVLEHLVEVADHVLHALKVFGGHVCDLLVHVLEEGVHHRFF